jgi:hypothetical protein
MIWEAGPTLTTAGRPYSRAIMAPWERAPPKSMTTPVAGRKYGVHAGSVNGGFEAVAFRIRGLAGLRNLHNAVCHMIETPYNGTANRNVNIGVNIKAKRSIDHGNCLYRNNHTEFLL